jgi:hypothetical protein
MMIASPPHKAAHTHSEHSPSRQRAALNLEMDALRERGLAKILNQHFSASIKKLAQEKAAADAALRDLEMRKHNTSEFVPSTNGELSPLDSLYVSVNQWRAECRMKEKETLLLYQRYVDKFGASGHVAAPTTAEVVNKDAAKPVNASAGSSKDETAIMPAGPPVPSMAAAIESTLEEYMKTGAIQLPSIDQLGVEETYAHKEEQEFRNFYRRQLEEMEKVRTNIETTTAAANNNKTPVPLAAKHRSNYETPTTMPETPFVATSEDLKNVHENGAIGSEQNKDGPIQANSFLRTIEGAANDSSPTKWATAATPLDTNDDYEQDEAHDNLGPMYVYHDDDDSDTVVSGLTINSALTRRIIDDCEKTVVTFLHEEQDAIRKLLSKQSMEASITESTAHVTTHTDVGSVQMQAAVQAENMAKQMKAILDDFEKKKTNAASSSTDDNDDDASLGVDELAEEQLRTVGRPYPTDNPKEDWVVLWDDTYKREYYHEKRSNTTIWNAPNNVKGCENGDGISTCASSSIQCSPDLSSAEVKPETESRAASRIIMYRRKRRRERKRKVLAIFAVLLCSIAAVVIGVYSVYTSATSTPFARAVVEPVLNKFGIQTFAQIAEKQARDLAERERIVLMERKAKEEEEAKRKRMEQERRVKEEAKRKAQAELVERMRREEEAKRKHEKDEEAKRQHDEEQVKRKVKEEAEQLDVQRQTRRHVACNIPFAYAVHRTCRKLSYQTMTAIENLVSSMLQ